MGVPLAHEKTEGPVNCLTYLGIELDSVVACSRLPEAKLEVLRESLKKCIGASWLSLWKLQALVGHLNFACRVVAPGQAFLQCLCLGYSALIPGLGCLGQCGRICAYGCISWRGIMGFLYGVQFSWWRLSCRSTWMLQVGLILGFISGDSCVMLHGWKLGSEMGLLSI